MLNKLLKDPMDRSKALYCLGQVIGLFPENSFEQHKYLLEPDADNEINELLTRLLGDFERQGMVHFVEDDKVEWNENFKVDTYLESIKRKKEERARQAQAKAAAKKFLRRFASVGQVLKDNFPSGLVMVITDIDHDAISITTSIRDNTNWAHAFNNGEKVIWEYSASYDDMLVLTANVTDKEKGHGAQNVMYVLDSGKIQAERDS